MRRDNAWGYTAQAVLGKRGKSDFVTSCYIYTALTEQVKQEYVRFNVKQEDGELCACAQQHK